MTSYAFLHEQRFQTSFASRPDWKLHEEQTLKKERISGQKEEIEGDTCLEMPRMSSLTVQRSPWSLLTTLPILWIHSSSKIAIKNHNQRVGKCIDHCKEDYLEKPSSYEIWDPYPAWAWITSAHAYVRHMPDVCRAPDFHLLLLLQCWITEREQWSYWYITNGIETVHCYCGSANSSKTENRGRCSKDKQSASLTEYLRDYLQTFEYPLHLYLHWWGASVLQTKKEHKCPEGNTHELVYYFAMHISKHQLIFRMWGSRVHAWRPRSYTAWICVWLLIRIGSHFQGEWLYWLWTRTCQQAAIFAPTLVCSFLLSQKQPALLPNYWTHYTPERGMRRNRMGWESVRIRVSSRLLK